MSQTVDFVANHVWHVYGASCIGKSHIDNGLPNQDHIYFQQTAKSLVAVVCDGAGSAKLSQDGAKFFSQAVGQMLLNLTDLDITNLSNIKQMITEQLASIRMSLQSQLAAELTLRDYHTTFTALLLQNPNQALLVEIGDSPLITSKFEVNDNHVDYFGKLKVYGDDSKNEYVNETHFITQDNWQDFLRIEAIDLADIDSIALMSDGCADLVFEGASITPQIYRPFFGNLLFNLCQSQNIAQGSAIIEQAISNPATYRLTGDDKSLIVLLKTPNQFMSLEPIVQSQTSAQNVLNNNQASVWNSTKQASQTIIPHAHGDSHIQAANANVPVSRVNNTGAPQVLPPSQTITSSTKQRRNTAVIAGAAMLIGTGVLGWLNKDKFLATQTMTATTAAASVASSTAASKVIAHIEPQAMDTPFTMEVNSEIGYLFDNSSSPDLALETIVASPQGQFIVARITANQVTSAKKPSAKNPQKPLLSLVVATLPSDKTATSPNLASTAYIASQTQASQTTMASTTVDSAQFINHPIKIAASIDCQPLADLNSLTTLGIAQQPNRDYQSCQIRLPIKTIFAQIPTLAKKAEAITSITLEKGLSDVLAVQNLVTASSTQSQLASAASSVSGTDTLIQLYYLSFKPSESSIDAATTTSSVSTPTHSASTPKR